MAEPAKVWGRPAPRVSILANSRTTVINGTPPRPVLRMGWRYAPLLVTAAAVAGCDIPMSAPNWETRWVVRAEDTIIPVSSFLPGQVTERNGTEFVIAVSGGGVSRSLGELCSACGPFNGTVVPKPAFSTTLQSDVPFPVDLDSLVLTGGSIQVRVVNNLGFDPIRPSAASGSARGQIAITLRNAGVVLGIHTIDGAVSSFAPGTARLETVTFSPAGLPRSIGGSVSFEVSITSPLGDPVAINTAQSMTVEAADAAVAASAAIVRVQDRAVTATPMTLDLSGLDSELTDRVQRGSLILDIANPLGVGGTLTATLSAPGVTLVRPFVVAPGESQARLAFSGDELRALFGPAPVGLSVSGSLSADPPGPVSVRPGQQIVATGRLEFFLGTSNPEDGQ